LEYVSVAIFSEHDQELVSLEPSVKQNGVSASKALEGEYYIEVSFIGYEKKVVDKITG
jgi:hypothetical protein